MLIVGKMIEKRLIRTYKELSQLQTFNERYRYLRIAQQVGDETFEGKRWMNQVLYHSRDWRDVRNLVIMRDNGCDLGIPGMEIYGSIYIHHITPLTLEDIEENSRLLLDPDNLICCSFDTHQAIHYGDVSYLTVDLVERKPNDTCPWK